ncbi:hypothetical protein NQZ68_001096 [Dissostichus eleginoides]|nr:hypothetical protein NQZ68_001096 [Dissostichus eleginoides]
MDRSHRRKDVESTQNACTVLPEIVPTMSVDKGMLFQQALFNSSQQTSDIDSASCGGATPRILLHKLGIPSAHKPSSSHEGNEQGHKCFYSKITGLPGKEEGVLGSAPRGQEWFLAKAQRLRWRSLWRDEGEGLTKVTKAENSGSSALPVEIKLKTMRLLPPVQLCR